MLEGIPMTEQMTEQTLAPLSELALAAGSEAVLKEALYHADDGELFLERARGESFVWDDGRLKSASYDSDEGFGLRVVAGKPPAMPMLMSCHRPRSSAPLPRPASPSVAIQGP